MDRLSEETVQTVVNSLNEVQGNVEKQLCTPFHSTGTTQHAPESTAGDGSLADVEPSGSHSEVLRSYKEQRKIQDYHSLIARTLV